MADEPATTEVKPMAPAQPVTAQPDDLTVVKQQLSQLVGIVGQQQEAFKRLQEVGLRTSDAAAIRDDALEANVRMGPSGFVVALKGSWTMGHINQVRLAMRQQMLLDATRMRMESQKSTLANRKTGEFPTLEEVQ